MRNKFEYIKEFRKHDDRDNHQRNLKDRYRRYRDGYLAAQGWSLHRSGGGCFGFSTLRQRLSLTGVWLLSRMHFRIVVRRPARCNELQF